jgi:hypothetical protein
MFSASPTPDSSRTPLPRGSFPILGAALAAVLCVYVNRHTLSFAFIPYDEDLQIVFNGHLGSPRHERLAWMFMTTGYNGYYMPLGWLFTSLLYTVSGIHPGPYHAALVGFHALNAVLIFVLVRRMLPAIAPKLASASMISWADGCALLGSLWWSLNPLRVESTAWVSGIFYAQALSFAFASVIVHLGPRPLAAGPGGEATGGPTDGWHRPAVATFLYACSLFTYPIALGLAPVFYVIDWFTGRRAGILDKAGFVAVAAVVLALTLQAERKGEAHFSIVEARLPLSIQAARAGYALSYYAVKPWVPTHLARAYPATLVPAARPGNPPRSFWSAQIYIGVAAALLSCALCALSTRFRSTVGPFLLCHILLLAPMTGITMNGDYVTFDRYCALACGAWAVGVAMFMAFVQPRYRGLVATAFCLYLLVLARMSELQTGAWRNWDSVVANVASHVEPYEFPELQYYSPAYVFKMAGQYDKASATVARGLRALPGDPTLLSIGREIAECRASYTRFCPFAEVHVYLGEWFVKTRDWREADEQLRLALELSPGYGEAAYNRALVRLNRGQYWDALHDFLWAEAHVPAPFSPQQRQAVLSLVAKEARAAGDLALEHAVLGGSGKLPGRAGSVR